MVDDPTLYVLTGPTAVGKTEISIQWAEAFEAEIVSCDSLLFYRGMNIGTAKPDLSERSRVTHHLIDVAEVDEPLDIRRYLELAQQAVADIQGRSRRVLVCGGSGFYLRSFFEPVTDETHVPEMIRSEVEDQLAREGLPVLVADLERINPEGLGSLDTQNPRRVVRALERCRASGLTLSELRDAMFKQTNALIRSSKVAVRLDRDRADLNDRILCRVHAMLEMGLVEEVRNLLARGIDRNPSAFRAVGYRETIRWLSRSEPIDQLVDAIATSTRRLVRKQRGWFRNQMPPHRVVSLQDGGVFSVSELFEPESPSGAIAIP